MELLPDGCSAGESLDDPPRPQGLHVVLVDKPTAAATAMALGFAVALNRTDPAQPAVRFFTDYLGLHRQSSGLLYQSLREARGLNYGDYAYVEHFEPQDETRFPEVNMLRRRQYASVWLRAVRPEAAHFALRAALRLFANALAGDIPADDFARTRAFLSAYVGLYAQTESARLGDAIDAQWIETLTGSSRPPFAEWVRQAWADLDPSAVGAAARRHLTARDVWVSIIAPDAVALAEAIRRNAPSPVRYDSPKPPEVLSEDREIAEYALPVRPEDVRVVPVAEVFR
jgi:zinc protease